MRVRLDLATKQEIRQAALFYEDCREGLGQEFVDSETQAWLLGFAGRSCKIIARRKLR